MVKGEVPPLAVGLPPICTDPPAQKALFSPASATGKGRTVTVISSVAVQPLASVTVTVYVVVVVGLAVTVDPVVVFNPAEGDQVYCPPAGLLAVKVVCCPEQIETLGDIVI